MICLVRHGETDWNYQGKLQGDTDIPLNATGIQQAEECREYFKNTQIDRIITTPLSRAKQTAEIINKDLNKPVLVMEEFIERSFGRAEGLAIEERERRYPDKIYPGQEEYSLFKSRIMQGLDFISKKYSNEKLLLVAHGGVINVILSVITKGEIGSGKTRLINACISNVELLEEGWRVHDYNQINHLSHYNIK